MKNNQHNNKNKIALVAPFRGENYGTVLQAYALAKKINDLGRDCEYISYTPYYRHTLWERIIRKILKVLGLLKDEHKRVEGIDDYSFYRKPEFASICKKCDDFSNKFIHYTKQYNPKTINSCPRYERYIVGSDQTWSMERCDKYGFYWLKWCPRESRKMAYAPSLGTTNLSDQHIAQIKKYISSFEYVSCREEKNAHMLSQILKKNVPYVVDPTMLIDKDTWRTLMTPITLPKQYVLAYILGEKDCISEFAEQLGKQYNIPVYYVLTRPKYLDREHVLDALGPQEWVYAIFNATYVITDSFHGTLFSINLNKDFYTFTKRQEETNILNDNDRIQEVLTTFGLMDRFVVDNMVEEKLRDIHAIEYAKINPTVVEQRKFSEDYLHKIIK